MIILIGGSSHVGKTLLAQKLMEKLAIPYLSLDHLKMMFIRCALTDLTVEDDYEMRYFLWPYASAIIKTAIENRQNMIVEGCYIPCEWRDNFDKEYLDDISCFYVTMSEDYLKKNFGAVKEYANVIESRIDDDADPDRLIRCSREFKQQALENNIPVIEITDRYDIEELAGRALEIVIGQDKKV